MDLIYDSKPPATTATRRKISSRTIRTINGLTADVLEEHGIIEPAKNGGYICVFCANGAGRDGTGIHPSKKIEDWTCWQCFKCGKTFNNIQMFAKVYGMDTRSEFVPLVEKICADVGVQCEYEDFAAPSRKRRTKRKSAVTEPTSPAELELIHADLNVSDEPLHNLCKYGSNNNTWRGLPLELLLAHGCRYISNWTTPASRAAKTQSFATQRMLVPSDGGSSYLARLTVPLKAFGTDERRYVDGKEKLHAGNKTLFNTVALNSDVPVFAVEGYIDALSLEFAGFAAVGLGAAARGDLLVDAVEKMTVKPRVVLLLDADKSGRDNAQKLYDELLSIGVPAVVRFLSDDAKNDANQILQEQGVEVLRGILQTIVDETLNEFAAIEDELTARREERISDDDINFFFDGDASDLDFAYRLERFCGDRVRWLSDDEKWLVYSNGFWTHGSEKNSCVSSFGRGLAELMKNFAQNADERELADKFKSAKKIGAAFTLLKSCDSIRITATDLDNHNELLNVRNGCIDLTDGKLYPHDSAKMITRQCRADFDANADTVFVEKFFCDIQPDEMTRRGLLRWLGYCLSGEVNEEKFAIWTGASGANGKGTLGGSILELLGSYATGLAPRALLKSNRPANADSATTALNSIEGARFALSEEMPLDAELDASLVKNLTGGDRINLRYNYGEYRTICASAKINLSGNFAPRIENVHDGGILRRMINFSFDVQFGTAERPADTNLKKKMLAAENQRGLLAMLVREAGCWYRGDGLIISAAMKRATARHLSQNDFVEEFLSDNYVLVPNASVKAKNLLDELRAAYPRETSRFRRSELIQLIANVDGVTYGEGGGNVRVFKGIGKALD